MRLLMMMLENKVLKKIVFFCFIFIFSCNDKSNNLWDSAKFDYENKDYESCVIKLNQIINKDLSVETLIQAKYLLSEIYLNE